MTPNKSAKVHSNRSQRVKPQDGERKVVFRGVLDHPHRISWPSVPLNAQNSILAHLVGLLDGVAEYHNKSRASSRKRKRLLGDDDNSEYPNKKTRNLASDQQLLSPACKAEAVPSESLTSQKPPILDHLTYGINEVTRRLENQIAGTRTSSVLKLRGNVDTSEKASPTIKYLFICRADVDPPILINHFPHLVASYNSLRKPHQPPVFLIPLPVGAESTLARAVGVRRIATIAIDSNFLAASERLVGVETLPLVIAPWLSSQPAMQFVQTHVKQFRTTAPRDMKAARGARIQGKAAAKARRQLAVQKETKEKDVMKGDRDTMSQ